MRMCGCTPPLSLCGPAAFLLYALASVACILYLVWVVAPLYGSDNVLVYLGICSLAGAFTVTSCKARAYGTLRHDA